MSHTWAARCTVCGRMDDDTCPECGTPSSTTHGIANQKPWCFDGHDGYRHEWHPHCLTEETP